MKITVTWERWREHCRWHKYYMGWDYGESGKHNCSYKAGSHKCKMETCEPFLGKGKVVCPCCKQERR